MYRGDFNEIRVISERVGCQRVDRGMQEFVDFGNNMELCDIPMFGIKFTRPNYQDRAIHSRMDRFLLSQSWLDNFKLVQQGIQRPISYHCSIVLVNDERD